MNELSNPILITLSAMATIGAISSITVICIFVSHYRGQHLKSQYRGLVSDIKRERDKLIKILNEEGNQTPEFRWAVDYLSTVASTRRTDADHELEEKLEGWREFFSKGNEED